MTQPDLFAENPVKDLVDGLHTAVGVLADIGLTPGDAAYVNEELDKLREQMRRLQVVNAEMLHNHLGDRTNDIVRDTAGESYVLRRNTKAVRGKLTDRDGLIRHVLRAAPAVHPANPSTGEVLHPAEAQVQALQECFRLEPRIGIITTHYGARRADFYDPGEVPRVATVEKIVSF